jgi:hypothetical protein
MSLMCDTCYRINDKRKYKSWLKCKDKNCSGYMIEVDELFLPSISLLNKKGYRTAYCCSAHIWENDICDPYISFDSYIKFPNLPKGFDYDKNIWPDVKWDNHNEGDKCIRKIIDVTISEEDKHEQLLITSLDLLNWVKQLPYIQENNELCKLP